MVTSLTEQLLRDEGVRLTLYRDPAGFLTIGCGRNLQVKGINESEMMLMLQNDITQFTAEVHRALPWTDSIDRIRREAFINMAFNMGIGALLQFDKMIAFAQKHDWINAAQQLIDSDYGRGVTRVRAARLAKQLITGEYQ